jgi:hypothetical protein
MKDRTLKYDVEERPTESQNRFSGLLRQAQERYMDLMSCVKFLTPGECQEFADLMNEFEDAEMRPGYCDLNLRGCFVGKQADGRETDGFSAATITPERTSAGDILSQNPGAKPARVDLRLACGQIDRFRGNPPSSEMTAPSF